MQCAQSIMIKNYIKSHNIAIKFWKKIHWFRINPFTFCWKRNGIKQFHNSQTTVLRLSACLPALDPWINKKIISRMFAFFLCISPSAPFQFYNNFPIVKACCLSKELINGLQLRDICMHFFGLTIVKCFPSYVHCVMHQLYSV